MVEVAKGAAPARGVRKRSEETLAAAARVFAMRGYHGATTEEIASLLGIRQASLYYYFRSKEEALEQVCVRGVAGYVEDAQAIAAAGGVGAGRLAALIRAHLLPLADRADFSRVFVHERRYLPQAARRRVGRLSRRYEQVIESVVRDGVADGSLAIALSPRMQTLAVLGLCNAALGWFEREKATSLPSIIETVVTVALRGLGNPQGADSIIV